jgi:filamentous hemagglutinin
LVGCCTAANTAEAAGSGAVRHYTTEAAAQSISKSGTGAEAQARLSLSRTSDGLAVTQSQRVGTSAGSRYRSSGGVVPGGSDVDHVIDLQLGGADDLLNMNPLDASVNRSLGAQIANQIRGLELGTRFYGASIG